MDDRMTATATSRRLLERFATFATPSVNYDAEYAEVLEYSTQREKEWLELCRVKNLPPPQLGHELFDGTRVVAHLQLAWVGAKVGVVAADAVPESSQASEAKALGWELVQLEGVPSALARAN